MADIATLSVDEFEDYYAVSRARALRERLEFQSDLTIAKPLDRNQVNSINKERRDLREEIERLLLVERPKVDMFELVKQLGGAM